MAVNATAVWRVRPSGGSNTNGGGYDAGISGAATDYSQQNSAQLSVSDAASVAASSIVTSVTGGFTAAMIGNACYITGTHFTTGWYFVTGFTNGNTITVDRDPTTGGNGVGGTLNLGGRWADFWTNVTLGGSPASPLIGGNRILVLGGGTPNPASYSPDYTWGGSTLFAAPSNLPFTIAVDPATPGYKTPPDTTGGMVLVSMNGSTMNMTFQVVQGFWFVATNGTKMVFDGHLSVFEGCVWDQAGFNVNCFDGFAPLIGCEFFSSVSGSVGGNYAVQGVPGGIIGCNIHDCTGYGWVANSNGTMVNSIVAKNLADGVLLQSGPSILNNTIDGNGGSGIKTITGGVTAIIINNLLTNHTSGGAFGLNDNAGNLGGVIDFNTYYNNTANLSSGLSYGPHDTHGGSNPYVGQSTENYTLA